MSAPPPTGRAALRRRRLRRRQPRQHRPGARERRRGRPSVATAPATSRGADALVVPGVGAAAPAMERLERGAGSSSRSGAGSPPTARSSASASGSSSCSRAATRTARRRSASCPAGRVRLDGRADRSPTSAGTRSSARRDHPLFAGHRARRRLLLRPLVRRRRPTDRTPTTSIARRRRPTAVRSCSAVARGHVLGVQFHPERSGADGLRLLANVVAAAAAGGRRRDDLPRWPALMLRRRVIPCLDVADGRVVKGTRFVDLVDEGDPPELAERYAARRRRRARLPRHHAPRRRAAGRSSTSSSGPPGGRSSRSPSAAASGASTDMRDVLRAGADKVSLNTAAVADPALVAALRGRASAGRRSSSRSTPAGATSRPAGLRGRSSCRAAARRPGLDAVAWAERVVDLGAGELLVTSIDRDGTGPASTRRSCARSPDGSACRSSRPAARAGPDDFVAAIRDGGADAVLAASIFHRRIHSIADVKRAMAAAGLPVRRGGGSGRVTTADEARDRATLGPERPRPRDRPGRDRRAGPDARLDGRGGLAAHPRDRRRPLPLAGAATGSGARARPRGHELRLRDVALDCDADAILAHGRSDRADLSPRHAQLLRPRRRTRRERRRRGSPGWRGSGRRSRRAPPSARPAPTRPACSRAASMRPAGRSPRRRPRS